MKKNVLLIAMAIVTVVGLTGCTKTKTVSTTDADGNTTTITETTENNETTIVVENTNSEGDDMSQEEVSEAVDEVMDKSFDEQDYVEPEYQVIESSDGYKVTFNPECFEYVEGGEYEGSNATLIRCTIDEENMYENYIDVSTVEDYSAEELIEGLALQNNSEASSMHIIFANGEYDAFYCENKVTDSFIISFYVIPGKDKPYLIEVGNHIYGDDDEYTYYVSGMMEETFLSLEFES